MWIMYPLQSSLLAVSELKVGRNELETSWQISMLRLEVLIDMVFIEHQRSPKST